MVNATYRSVFRQGWNPQIDEPVYAGNPQIDEPVYAE